jgi:hypothetical protein
MHLAPKQILVNAHVNLKNDLTNTEIIQTIAEIEAKIKEAEPKVDMIFLETAGLKETKPKKKDLKAAIERELKEDEEKDQGNGEEKNVTTK